MRIIDGKKIAQDLKNSIKKQVALLERKPGLATVLVGDNPASLVYVNNKEKACKEVGFYSLKVKKPANISQDKLLDIIVKLNQDSNIDGILVQLPLPPHLDTQAILQSIEPSKDVDGFHYCNAGRLLQNQPFLRPCTAKGVMHLLAKSGIEVVGKSCVIVGTSNIVGRPMAIELLNQQATITLCNSKTKNLARHLQQADIVVIAVGKVGLVKKTMLKPGCVVIDVGINRLDNNTLVGDVDFEDVKDIAAQITPVPGGVGPMTIASLLDNTLIAYQQRSQQNKESN